MAKRKTEPQVAEEGDELTEEELERVNGEPLPDREEMAMVFPGPPGVQMDPSEFPINPTPPELS
jgi:hypothetical protein